MFVKIPVTWVLWVMENGVSGVSVHQVFGMTQIQDDGWRILNNLCFLSHEFGSPKRNIIFRFLHVGGRESWIPQYFNGCCFFFQRIFCHFPGNLGIWLMARICGYKLWLVNPTNISPRRNKGLTRPYQGKLMVISGGGYVRVGLVDPSWMNRWRKTCQLEFFLLGTQPKSHIPDSYLASMLLVCPAPHGFWQRCKGCWILEKLRHHGVSCTCCATQTSDITSKSLQCLFFENVLKFQDLQVLSIVLGLFRVYRRWHPTQLNGDYFIFINHEIRIPNKQPGFNGSKPPGDFHWMMLLPLGYYRTTWHWMMPSSPKEEPKQKKGGEVTKSLGGTLR